MKTRKVSPEDFLNFLDEIDTAGPVDLTDAQRTLIEELEKGNRVLTVGPAKDNLADTALANLIKKVYERAQEDLLEELYGSGMATASIVACGGNSEVITYEDLMQLSRTLDEGNSIEHLPDPDIPDSLSMFARGHGKSFIFQNMLKNRAVIADSFHMYKQPYEHISLIDEPVINKNKPGKSYDRFIPDVANRRKKKR